MWHLIGQWGHPSLSPRAKINRPLPNAWQLNAPLQFRTTLLIRSQNKYPFPIPISVLHSPTKLKILAVGCCENQSLKRFIFAASQESIYSPPSAMWICHCQILGNELQMQSLFPLFASRFRVMQAEFIKPFTWSQHPLLICTFSQSSSIFTVISYYLFELTCPPALWTVQIPSC